MGRYMRKSSKNSGELAVMDVISPASLGVRTRAKTLALQKSISGSGDVGGSYVQPRIHRHEKPPINGGGNSKRQRKQQQSSSVAAEPKSPNSKSRAARLKTGSLVNSGSGCLENEEQGKVEEEENELGDVSEDVEGNQENGKMVDVPDLGIKEEASFGENLMEFEGRERRTRETTPSNLIRDPDSVRTPGSTTRRTSSPDANRRAEDPVRKHIPTANEMNEFFADAEEQQQKQFIDKYNYDPVNDEPLPGQYEWVKVDP